MLVGVKIDYDEIKVRNFLRNVFFEKKKDKIQKNREVGKPKIKFRNNS